MTESSRDPDGTEKADGLGGDGTIPNKPGGVGVGAGEPTTFEPEEDPEAAAERGPDSLAGEDSEPDDELDDGSGSGGR